MNDKYPVIKAGRYVGVITKAELTVSVNNNNMIKTSILVPYPDTNSEDVTFVHENVMLMPSMAWRLPYISEAVGCEAADLVENMNSALKATPSTATRTRSRNGTQPRTMKRLCLLPVNRAPLSAAAADLVSLTKKARLHSMPFSRSMGRRSRRKPSTPSRSLPYRMTTSRSDCRCQLAHHWKRVGHLPQALDTYLPVSGACFFGDYYVCTTHDADLATDLCDPRTYIRSHRVNYSSLPSSTLHSMRVEMMLCLGMQMV